MPGDFSQPQRSPGVPDVSQQPRGLGPTSDKRYLFGGEARDGNVTHLPGFVEQQHRAVTGLGQRSGLIRDALKYGVQVKVLVDAETGFPEFGKSVQRRRALAVQPSDLLRISFLCAHSERFQRPFHSI